MGSKYASIFIFDPEHNYEERSVRELYGCKNASYEERLNEQIERYMRLARLRGENEPSDSVVELLRSFVEIDEEALTFVWREPYWCVFDENLSYGQVTRKAKKVSKLTTAPILYTANYDDDIFLAGLIVDGKEQFQHIFGKDVSEYSLKEKRAKLEKLQNLPGKQPEAVLIEFCYTNDVLEAQKLFARIIGIPLNLLKHHVD